MTKPGLVLFDLGNVLVRFTPDRFWKSLGLSEPERRQYEQPVRAQYFQFESGHCSFEEHIKSLGTIFANQFEKEILIRAFESVLTDPIPGMEDLVKRVSAKVPSALVSNTNGHHYAYSVRTVPGLRYLPKHYVSYELHVMKPAPAFYEYVLLDSNISASNCIFIDDVEENVVGAQRAGMKAILFQDAVQLEQDIMRLGVI
jgi:HAD superfamily hydrolase (TIGR01509 family)